MKKKLIVTCLAVASAVVCALSVSACNSGNDNSNDGKHKHTYSETWASDENYHWHAATCEHTDNVKGKEKHSYTNGVCKCYALAPDVPDSTGLDFFKEKDEESYWVCGLGTVMTNYVKIPAMHNGLPVTGIFSNAFYQSTGIKSIYFPASMTNICDMFSGYNSLECVAVASDSENYYCVNNCIVEKATDSIAFACNSSVIPADGSIREIGNYAFCGLTLLTEINIPDCITKIGNGAFSRCKFTSVTIPAGVTEISDRLFYACASLKTVNLPNGITSIGRIAFSECTSLKNITLPNSVTSIDYQAFSDSAITEITIPDGLTTIGEKAFYNCESLTTITIPNSVTEIGHVAFEDCERLSRIIYKGTVNEWKAIEKDPYYINTGSYIVYCTDGKLDSSGKPVPEEWA